MFAFLWVPGPNRSQQSATSFSYPSPCENARFFFPNQTEVIKKNKQTNRQTQTTNKQANKKQRSEINSTSVNFKKVPQYCFALPSLVDTLCKMNESGMNGRFLELIFQSRWLQEI